MQRLAEQRAIHFGIAAQRIHRLWRAGFHPLAVNKEAAADIQHPQAVQTTQGFTVFQRGSNLFRLVRRLGWRQIQLMTRRADKAAEPLLKVIRS